MTRTIVVHIALAVPWLVGAASIGFLALSHEANGPIELAAVPLLVGGVAVWLGRRWWLVGASLVFGVAGAIALVGVGLNFIDHVASGQPARFIAEALSGVAGPLVLLVTVAAGVLVGVIEWRDARHVPA